MLKPFYKLLSLVRARVGFALLLLVAAAAAFVLTRTGRNTVAATSTAPKVVLWAWERSEDLSFLDPKRTDVAYLAETLVLDSASIHVEPRRQLLRVPSQLHPIAVVRVENGRYSLNAQHLPRMLAEIERVAQRSKAGTIQIDYDVKDSERELYKTLLTQLRASLPESMHLSITALASWCQEGKWLNSLPIDEAVPMLFRLGVNERTRDQYLSHVGSFAATSANSSVGISLDEPVNVDLARPIKYYIFNPRPWTRDAVSRIDSRLNRE